MNRIFKVIWNRAKRCYVVASELAKSYSKGGGSRTIRRAATALCIAAAVYAATGSAIASNSGGQPVVVSPTQTDYVGTENEQNKYEVTIPDNVTGCVYGHKETSENVNVEKTSVTMTGGTVNKDLMGGRSYSGNAVGNSVNISGGTVKEDIAGGYSDSADANRNNVEITGGTMLGKAIGGYSYDGGNTSDNSVSIIGDTKEIKQAVYGGYNCRGNGFTKNNKVIISSGIIGEFVAGG